MKVLKFAGAAISSPDAVEQLRQVVAGEEKPCIVVVSALSTVRQKLDQMFKERAHQRNLEAQMDVIKSMHLFLAQEVLGAETLASYSAELEATVNNMEQMMVNGAVLQINDNSLSDYVQAQAVQLAALLVAAVLCDLKAQVVDGRQLLVTDEHFSAARVLWDESAARVRTRFENFKGVAVVSGSCGQTLKGYTTTLGRGGADLSASFIGSVLGAAEIDIWTTSDGIREADPELCPAARTLALLTYAEAAELSHSGVRLLFPPAIWPAVKENVPVRLRNIFRPAEAGTLISADGDVNDKRLIKGISHIPNVSLITLYGYGLLEQVGTSYRLFGLMAEHRINVMFISQACSEFSISFAVKAECGEEAVELIREAFGIGMQDGNSVVIQPHMAIVAMAGNQMRNTPGTSGRIFMALGDAGVNIAATAQGGGELNISIVVSSEQVQKASNVLYDKFLCVQ